MNATTNPIEELDREACLALLQTASFGRLAVGRPDGPPHVVPVNYAVLRGSVVFRSLPGTKRSLLVTEPVTFEVDSWDPRSGMGWSVVLQGLAYEASDREMEGERLDLDSPAEQQTSRWVRLMPDTITGRRITRPGPDARPVPAVEFVPDWGAARHEPVTPDGFVADWRLGAWHGGGSERFPA
ncbi:MAG TPA: pyridoxamine 5'-phosphate oxidase family protein [Acidimicrobiia bacterium]|nr:pyridoxamine 5'-phosphate oxidase family protein [Acidimicrobiia bacterium]